MAKKETELPFPKKETKERNPRLLIIFSKPKIGKTTLVSKLDDCLVVELEPGGAEFVSGNIVEVNSLSELKKVGGTIKEHNRPYKYLAVDTVTKLEDMVLPLAAQLYKRTPMAKNWTGSDVRTLQRGSGYLYLRQAFFQVINEIKTWADYIILLGHLRDSLIEKDGEEFNSKELDLTGKIRSLLSAESDAIAYFYRDEDEGFLNFKPTEDMVAGCRSPHLDGQVIKISKKENGEVKTNWKAIYKFD